MDPEERARRREERRRQREEDERAEAEEEARMKRREERRRERHAGAAAETNGPTEENGLSNEVEEGESDRLRQEQEEKQRLAAEKEKKRNAEIERQRLEDEERAKAEAEGRPVEQPKKKFNLMGRVSKGRKKEILQMLLKKARGDLQLEEQEAAAEKAKYITDNLKESNVESMSKEQLRQLCQALHDQLELAEGEKFDLEIKVKRRDLQISNLKVKANETRGKFVMPKLKTVSKK